MTKNEILYACLSEYVCVHLCVPRDMSAGLCIRDCVGVREVMCLHMSVCAPGYIQYVSVHLCGLCAQMHMCMDVYVCVHLYILVGTHV